MVLYMSGFAGGLFYNMPFETLNLKVADFLLIIATILSIVSAVQYYNLIKNIVYIKKK